MAVGWWARASNGLSRTTGRRSSSTIIWDWAARHLLFRLDPHSSPTTFSPSATATSIRLCDQGMAEWSNNGDPDDYPPRSLSRDSSRDRRRPGTASGASRLMILVANYLPRLTAGMVRPTPRKRRMVSMNLATEIGFDR